jgi:hypothetical protein
MIIPVFEMVSRITIGKLRFPVCSSIKIEESIQELGNTATIVLPRNYGTINGKGILEYIKKGDKVLIEFGYDGDYATEFEGYVRMINAEMPLQIECDDAFYLLKQNNWIKSYESVTLKALLQEIITGFQVEAPELTLKKFQLDNVSSYLALRKIQQEYGLYTRIIGNKLHVGFSYDWQGKGTTPFIYHRQKNVKASNLKWKRMEDVNVKVKVEWMDENRKKKYIEVGTTSKGAKVEKVTYGGVSEAEAKNIGRARLKTFVYDGFTGSFTGFCYPRVHAGDAVTLQDNVNPDKQGTYLLSRVTITYDESGAISRENTVSYKV